MLALDDSRGSYGDEENGESEEENGEEDGSPGQEDMDFNNELSELQGLGGAQMGAAAEKDYVEPSAHDMRRSKQVNAAMVSKLNK